MATADATQLCSMRPIVLDAENAEGRAQADAVKSKALTLTCMLQQPAGRVTYTRPQLDFIVPFYAARPRLSELPGHFSVINVEPHS